MLRSVVKWAVVALLVGAAAAVFVQVGDPRDRDPPSPMDRAEELREELRDLRARIDTCLARQERLEAGFRAQMRRTERLRARVREFETMEPEGVPAEEYGAYLEAFDEYNESIPEWERQGELLEGQARRCRAFVKEHNDRLETLQELLPELFDPPAAPG